MKRLCKCIAILLIAINLTAAVGCVAAGLALAPYSRSAPDDALLQIARSGGSSRLYAYDFSDRCARVGTAYEIGPLCGGSTYYEYASYDQIPRALVDAFVAVEDKRFWKHEGVDFLRTGEAVISYVQNRLRKKGGKTFGASTITQQLIKNLTGDDRISIDRKLTEMFSALDLERRASKSEILEMYLNVINLADGCHGVGAAAKHYFSKEIGQLSVGECACIAAITNNPARYNPITHPEQNEQRRQIILSCMLEQGYLDGMTYQVAAQPITLSPESREQSGVASWYEDMVVRDVIDDLCSTYGYSRAVASGMVYGGGLRIYAAMDARVQNILEQYYANTDIFVADERSCMIIIDPATGDILGVAGAIGEKSANRLQNYATDTRLPPGSAIKPLSVYAPALEWGLINWASVYDDVPLRFEGDRPWPRNAHYAYHGLTTAATALAESVNTVAVEILEEVGRERSLTFLREELGLTSLGEHDITQAGLALGQFSHGVTLRELTAAYSVFLTGNYPSCRSYYRVTDAQGVPLLTKNAEPRAVLRPENAAIMTKMMQEVVKRGTAKGKIRLADKIEVAGKTGTTQRGVDRLFVGYTPAVVGGVWTGYDYPAEQSGIEGNVSVTAWDEVMTLLYDAGIFKDTPDAFAVPDTVQKLSYCADSGALPSHACTCDLRGTRSRIGFFTQDNLPQGKCQAHVLVPYDRVFGKVAGEFCPSDAVSDVGLLRGDRSFTHEVFIKDAPYFLWDTPAEQGEHRGIWYATPSKAEHCEAHTAPDAEPMQPEQSEPEQTE